MVAFPDAILAIVNEFPLTCTFATLVSLLVAEYGPLPPLIEYTALVPGVIETWAGADVNNFWLLVVSTAIETLPPAASVIAMFAVPGAMPATVNEFPLTLAVATLVSLVVAT
jgi:multidrug efflux pump subunit AcrB